MEKVEQDLEKSRTSREKQAKEFTRQIENERSRHEKLVRCSVRNEMSMEKAFEHLRRRIILGFRVEDFV